LKTFDYTEADYIFENYIEIEPIEQITINTNNTLKDIKVCITGKLKTFKNRDAFKTAIENAGGKVVGSVTANTNYLINNDVTSKTSKNLKAIELGIEIISEGDFIKRFGL
jgi:DNA ligase (NAD+)